MTEFWLSLLVFAIAGYAFWWTRTRIWGWVVHRFRLKRKCPHCGAQLSALQEHCQYCGGIFIEREYPQAKRIQW